MILKKSNNKQQKILSLNYYFLIFIKKKDVLFKLVIQKKFKKHELRKKEKS